MNTKHNASNAAINGFTVGYKAVDATLNVVDAVTTKTSDSARVAKHSVTGFFGGMRYAIAQRRGESLATKLSHDEEKAIKAAKREADLAERRRFYERAHSDAVPSTAGGVMTPVIVLGHER